jgi:hypothetical protein
MLSLLEYAFRGFVSSKKILMSASTDRQLSQPKLNIDIPAQSPQTRGNVKQDLTNRQQPADFSQLPKELTLIDKLGLSTPSQYQRGQLRASTTPSQISIASIIILLGECSRGIKNLNHHIPGLERLSRQIKEVQVAVNLIARIRSYVVRKM